MNLRLLVVAGWMALWACGLAAAEVKVLATNAVKSVLEELVPQFERSSGHKVTIRAAPSADLKAQIEKGETFDLTILTAAAIDDLIKQGKLAATTRAHFATAGAGVAIRRGSPKPDISTTDAFKRALLDAKSIAYVATGATGANMRRIFEKLGIAEEMLKKTKLLSGISAPDAIARGDAELGFTQISEILPVAGAELAGPLPPELQILTVHPMAVSMSAASPEAAKSLLDFLRAPAAAALIKAKGMDPSAP